MNLPDNLFAVAFRQQRLGLMLTFLIGIMVYLGSLAMAAQSVLARTSWAWGHDLQNKLTLELPGHSGEKTEKQQTRAESVVSFLKQRPEVVSVSLLPETETSRLLKPWIDDDDLLQSLALPRLMDVEVRTTPPLDIKALKTSLMPIVGEVKVHRHEQGMTQLMGFLRGLGALSGLMLFLTAATLVVIISIICRAAIAVQHDTLELLHYMGATDRHVVQHFQDHIRRLTIPAASIGFGFAVLTVCVLAMLLGSLGGLSLVSSVSWVTIAFVMTLVPVCASFLAIATARFSVQKLLGRLL